MSNYGEFIKTRKENDKKFFYGESVHDVSNKYFTFDHVIDDDNIIIITNNIKFIKESAVLVVDNNKAVYLKDWQFRRVHNYDFGINGYAVKLNRNFFKPYTFRFEFEDMSFDEEETFDSLKAICSDQTMPIAEGWMN